MEHIDPAREVASSAVNILDTLAAFGLVTDGRALFHSTRVDAHAAVIGQRRATDQLFPRC